MSVALEGHPLPENMGKFHNVITRVRLRRNIEDCKLNIY
jgi:hypothetical protein